MHNTQVSPDMLEVLIELLPSFAQLEAIRTRFQLTTGRLLTPIGITTVANEAGINSDFMAESVSFIDAVDSMGIFYSTTTGLSVSEMFILSAVNVRYQENLSKQINEDASDGYMITNDKDFKELMKVNHFLTAMYIYCAISQISGKV